MGEGAQREKGNEKFVPLFVLQVKLLLGCASVDCASLGCASVGILGASTSNLLRRVKEPYCQQALAAAREVSVTLDSKVTGISFVSPKFGETKEITMHGAV